MAKRDRDDEDEKPAPEPPKRTTRTDERPDPLTHVILEDGNAVGGSGVVTPYELGPEPPRAFQLNGKYYEHARVDEKTGVHVYRWNDWR